MFLKSRFMSVLTLALSFSLWGQTYTPPPGTPLGDGVHPRVAFTATSFQDIRDYIVNYESADFQTFVNTVDGVYNLSAASKSKNFLIADGMNFAFLSYAVHSGLFSGFSFGHSASEYAGKAYEHAAEIANRVFTQGLNENRSCSALGSNSEGGYINICLASIYDWCYPYLSTSQKQTIAEAVLEMYKNRDSAVYPGREIHLGNANSVTHVGAGGAMAFYGDSEISGEPADSVQAMIDMIQWMWYDRVFLMGDHMFEGTAGWSEGADYLSAGHIHISWMAAALGPAIGINPFQEFRWLHDMPLYLYFYTFPMEVNGRWQGFFMQRNDDTSLRAWAKLTTFQQFLPTIAFLKQVDPDYAGFYRWILEDSPYATGDLIEGADKRIYWLHHKFLWGIKDVPKKTPEQVGIRKAYRFGLGEVIIRSDLTTQNATKINFYTPKYAIPLHKHADEGGFTIWKYGNLAIDAGTGKNGFDLPKADFSFHPIYHNVLALYPPGKETYEYSSSLRESADTYYHPDNQPGGRNHVGNVLALKFVDDVFAYVQFDYKPAYKGENYVNKIERSYIYLYDPNAPNYTDQEYFIVFDDVDVSSNVKRRWLLHTPGMPQLVDGSWNPAGTAFWTANNGSQLAVSSTYANAHGKLYLKVLAPSNYQLRLRGGESGGTYYWYTDALGNNLYRGIGTFDDWGEFWVSSYRLEIEHQTSGGQSQYLVVMQIGDANTLTNMAPVQAIDTGIFTGALINQDRIVFFNKSGSRSNTISYSFSSSKTVRHVITGLEQGQYFIRVDGNQIASDFVDENGVLYFEHPGGGSFVISKSNDTTPPATPSGLRIIR